MIMVEYQEFVLQYSDLIDYVKEWLIGFSPVVPLSRVALHINDCRRWLNVHIIARKRYIVPLQYYCAFAYHSPGLHDNWRKDISYILLPHYTIKGHHLTKMFEDKISRDRDFAIGDINIGILWNLNIWELEVLIR